MRLAVKKATNVHTDLAAACGWSVWNELYSAADDQTVAKWNLGGEPEGKVSACACSVSVRDRGVTWASG